MRPEQFDKFCEDIESKFLKVLKAANTDRDFDIENPLFFYSIWSEEEQQAAFEIFNDPDKFPLVGNYDSDQLTDLFKHFLQYTMRHNPSRVPVMASLILSGGYEKDPKTGERLGEVITLTAEDADRNVGGWIWRLTRPESGPVELTLAVKHVEHDSNYESFGGMQNMFNHEPRERKEELN